MIVLSASKKKSAPGVWCRVGEGRGSENLSHRTAKGRYQDKVKRRGNGEEGDDESNHPFTT